ncbi:hypothetical protein RHSIM_Rhsim09G0169700 [Rhododendron simsii]|uniref:GAG-pre-integrase domain-containing protein n=1 Tax=Rhododendron simsii TaxID=118357 RepID=A0A834GEG8_RHOSS|nr:hypothetical protein RHSIM_Rhsim09G0169700 [Rhododendron simsii]
MEERKQTQKPQANNGRLVLFPTPAQGHINPMLQLANILHSRGFSITLIHTHFNSPAQSDDRHFTFLPISDRLSLTEASMENLLSFPTLLSSNCAAPFQDCLAGLLADGPIACLITDAIWHFSQSVAEGFGIPRIVLRTGSVSSFLVYAALPMMREKGYLPKQDSQLESPVPESLRRQSSDLAIQRTALLRYCLIIFDSQGSSSTQHLLPTQSSIPLQFDVPMSLPMVSPSHNTFGSHAQWRGPSQFFGVSHFGMPMSPYGVPQYGIPQSGGIQYGGPQFSQFGMPPTSGIQYGGPQVSQFGGSQFGSGIPMHSSGYSGNSLGSSRSQHTLTPGLLGSSPVSPTVFPAQAHFTGFHSDSDHTIASPGSGSLTPMGPCHRGLYPLLKSSKADVSQGAAFVNIADNTMLWHRKLGHPSTPLFHSLIKQYNLPVTRIAPVSMPDASSPSSVLLDSVVQLPSRSLSVPATTSSSIHTVIPSQVSSIERAIRRVMLEREGEEMRERILCLKEKVDACLKEGGSSYQYLEQLITHILSFQ